MGWVMDKEYSLERELKDTRWLVDKVRSSDSYAQNLYAALCNNEFQKLEVMPVLKDEVWSCTWRYAGGLIAGIRCKGDYMDWYCSGMRFAPEEGFLENGFVPESVITDEIKQDLKSLGWAVVEDRS